MDLTLSVEHNRDVHVLQNRKKCNSILLAIIYCSRIGSMDMVVFCVAYCSSFPVLVQLSSLVHTEDRYHGYHGDGRI